MLWLRKRGKNSAFSPRFLLRPQLCRLQGPAGPFVALGVPPVSVRVTAVPAAEEAP